MSEIVLLSEFLYSTAVIWSRFTDSRSRMNCSMYNNFNLLNLDVVQNKAVLYNRWDDTIQL